MYAPQLGRFISRDSLDDSKDEYVKEMNLYEYVRSNPTCGIDPTGLDYVLGPRPPFAAVDPLFASPGVVIVARYVALRELNGKIVGVDVKLPVDLDTDDLDIAKGAVVTIVSGNGYIALRAINPGGGIYVGNGPLGCVTIHEIIFSAQGNFVSASYEDRELAPSSKVKNDLAANLSNPAIGAYALDFKEVIDSLNNLIK